MTADVDLGPLTALLPILNGSADPLGVVDARGYYLWINDAGERFSGYPRDQVIGSHFRDHLVDAPSQGGVAMDRARHGDPAITVRRVRRADGDIATVRTELIPLPGDLVLIHATDLTTLYDALDRVSESEAVLARAQQIGGTGSWVLRLPEGTVRWFGPRGFLQDAAMGEFFEGGDETNARVVPDDRDLPGGCVRRAIEHGSDSVEFRVAGPDGETRWVRMYAVATRESPDTEVMRVEGVLHDITEFHERDERYRQLLAAVRVPMLIWTPHDEQHPSAILYVNAALCDMLGEDEAELMGRLPRDWVREDDRAMLAERLPALGPGEFLPPTQVHVRLAEGTWATCLIVASHVRFQGRTAICAQVVDISEEVRLREEVSRARETDIALGVAAGVAHDFNNLLTGVLGYLEFAEEELAADSTAGRYVQAASLAARRAANLARALLGYSRSSAAEGAHREEPPTVVDVRDVMREAYAVTRAAISRTVDMTTHEDGDDDAHARIGADTLLRVLVNLVVNARDAVLQRAEQAPSGFRPRIDLGARVLHDEGVVEVWVADNGVGIPAEIGERVFESFFTTKGQRGGSGLGLQGARSLARSAGGDLTFTSEPGVGTTFTLRLPRSESPGNPDV